MDEKTWRRIERFFTGRSDGKAMEAEALRELAGMGAMVNAEFTPTNMALRYGRDYFLGDLVKCVLWPGFSVVKPVREVRRKVSVTGGVEIIPTAGDYSSSSDDDFTTKDLIRVVNSLPQR